MTGTELLEHFRDLLPSIRGILIYGSHVRGYADERSDIDICLIINKGADRAPVHRRMLTAGDRYDIVIFDEIPWYLKGEILEAHRVLYASDPDDLDFWLYRQRAVWEDMKHRQMPVSPETCSAALAPARRAGNTRGGGPAPSAPGSGRSGGEERSRLPGPGRACSQPKR